LANNKKKLYSLHKKDLYLWTVKLYSMEKYDCQSFVFYLPNYFYIFIGIENKKNKIDWLKES